MLREKILRKIYMTTLIVFVLFIISSFTVNKTIPSIKTEYQTKLSKIYLLDDDNYLLEVSISVKDNINDNIPIVFNNLKDTRHYSGLKGLIPVNTKINNYEIKDKVLNIDFSDNLLNINDELKDKLIESIVYSYLNFKEIDKVRITINNKELNEINNSYPNVLTRDIGINKEYSINSIKDIKKVVLYYYEEKEGNKYYVPVTKYLNSKDDKIKIIIDNLKTNYLVKTNLMSYLNDKVRIDKYEKTNNIVTISFASILDFNDNDILEEVIYTLSNSIIDSNEAVKVIFTYNDQILNIK